MKHRNQPEDGGGGNELRKRGRSKRKLEERSLEFNLKEGEEQSGEGKERESRIRKPQTIRKSNTGLSMVSIQYAWFAGFFK